MQRYKRNDVFDYNTFDDEKTTVVSGYFYQVRINNVKVKLL